MIQISQLKLTYHHTQEELEEKLLKLLRIRREELLSYTVEKRSLDARKKPELYYVYTVHAEVAQEKRVLKRVKSHSVSGISPKRYRFPVSVTDRHPRAGKRPVIVGSGPAGLFCAYMLAENGFAPILLERGKCVEERIKDVEHFWESGVLHPESNVQFGEGGAGTFSDGKLNTLVKDASGRNRKVLEIFVKEGAPEEILFDAKPHIGTDLLVRVVQNMRNRILECGGEVRFESKVTKLLAGKERVTGVVINEAERLEAEAVVLAVGHSARDTFEMLSADGIPMEAKAFAVGVRVEHPQSMVNFSQYGAEHPDGLSAASYKLAQTLPCGRGVYSFCMCPGGYVVNASSEEGLLAVNGMSYHDRAGENANSAIIVTVTPEDYGGDGPLAGVRFQRELERKAYKAGDGRIPVQSFADFCGNRTSKEFSGVTPCMKGACTPANVRAILPEFVAASIEEGIRCFDAKIHGFARPDALLSGVESRTSSPVRIVRDASLESAREGLFPCGEGAGYAGGITSAAMDGIKVAEAVAARLTGTQVSRIHRF